MQKNEKEEALKRGRENEDFNSDYKEQELELQRTAKAKGNIDQKEKDLPSLGETKIVIGKDFNVNIIDGDEMLEFMKVKEMVMEVMEMGVVKREVF